MSAHEFGLAIKPAKQDGKPLTRMGKPTDMAMASTLQIGDFSINNVPLIVLPAKELRSLVKTSIDGFIGSNVLAHFTTLFDFPRHSVTLWFPGGLSDAEVGATGFKGVVPLPVTATGAGYPFFVGVEFRNAGQQARENMIIDTGGGMTIISKNLAETLKLSAEGSFGIESLSGHLDLNQSSVDTIRLGGFEARKQIICYPVANEASYPVILGVDFLSGYRGLLDFPAQKMYIAPPTTVAPPVQIKPVPPAGEASPAAISPQKQP